jgi:hypothetical protein
LKTNRIALALVLAMLGTSVIACGGSFSTAKIKSAALSADSSGAPETTVFGQDQVFYCLVELANAPDDTTVKAVWYAVSVEGTEPNLLIDQSELTLGDGTATFNLTNNQLWPVGTYKVEIYLNGELNQTLEFQVQ